MIGIPLGLAVGNAAEWAIHKHILHGRGRHKTSFWAFHWHDHHRNSRKDGHLDVDYRRPWWAATGQRREAIALTGASLALAPLFPIAPFFTATLWYSAARYHRVHKRAHLDPDFARDHLPWHYDHHMGPDQNANWCVTRPWFDHVMGTRKPYLGTARGLRDARRQAARRARETPSSAAAGTPGGDGSAP